MSGFPSAKTRRSAQTAIRRVQLAIPPTNCAGRDRFGVAVFLRDRVLHTTQSSAAARRAGPTPETTKNQSISGDAARRPGHPAPPNLWPSTPDPALTRPDDRRLVRDLQTATTARVDLQPHTKKKKTPRQRGLSGDQPERGTSRTRTMSGTIVAVERKTATTPRLRPLGQTPGKGSVSRAIRRAAWQRLYRSSAAIRPHAGTALRIKRTEPRRRNRTCNRESIQGSTRSSTDDGVEGLRGPWLSAQELLACGPSYAIARDRSLRPRQWTPDQRRRLFTPQVPATHFLPPRP